VLCAAVAGKLLGADDFRAYPTVQLGFGPATVALSAVLVLSGLAPWRRAPKRAATPAPVMRPSAPRGPGAAPRPPGLGAATPPRGAGASPSLGATGV